MKFPIPPHYSTIFLLLVFFAYSEVERGSPYHERSELSGKLVFPHAGEIFTYDLSNQSIDFLAERKGRLGPFFSPDGTCFTTNNWPGNNEGVAVWELATGTIQREFQLESTLTPAEKGIKVAPGGTLFSAVINTPAGENPDLVIMDAQGEIRWRLDGDGMRIKGHIWDAQQNLYLTGEVLKGATQGTLFLAKVPDWEARKFQVIRTFSGAYFDLPDEMTVSADGNRIAYNYDKNIWVGATQEGATDHQLCFEAIQTLARPVFSPDGNYLALAMLNSPTSRRGDIHIAKIPETGATTLLPDGASKLPGPNSSSKSTWTSGGDSSIGWFE